MMDSPTISCVCVTHGRAHFLNETLESFLRQEIEDFSAELLICSDCPEQVVECDLPNVRVVNTDPIPDLSLKFNMAVGEARGEYVAWWEDDDISLPFRLRHSMREIRSSGKCYYKQNMSWFLNFDEMKLSENLFFGNSMFRRDSYIKSGGSVQGIPADLSAHQSMINHCGLQIERCHPEDVYFIYRWGGMEHHDSGVVGTNLEKFEAFRKATLSSPNFVPGRVKLCPKWNRDYSELVKDHMRKGN